MSMHIKRLLSKVFFQQCQVKFLVLLKKEKQRVLERKKPTFLLSTIDSFAGEERRNLQ